MKQVAVEARRISGAPSIPPSELVKLQMERRGVVLIGAHVHFCLSSSGLVESLRFHGASGFPTYDLELVETLRTWRYSPFMIDGKARTVCTAVTFVHRQI